MPYNYRANRVQLLDQIDKDIAKHCIITGRLGERYFFDFINSHVSIRNNSLWTWLAIGAAMTLAVLAILWFFGTNESLRTFIIFCTIIFFNAVLPIKLCEKMQRFFRYLVALFRVQDDEICNLLIWYKKKLRGIFGYSRNALLWSISFALFFALLALLGEFYFVPSTVLHSSAAKVLFVIVDSLAMISSILLGWYCINVNVFIMRLVDDYYKRKHGQPVEYCIADVEPIGLSAEGLKEMRKLSYFATSIVAIPYILFATARMLDSWDWNLLVYIWYFALAIIMLLPFFYAQSRLNEVAKETRTRYLAEVEKRLSDLIERVKSETCLEDLVKIGRELNTVRRINRDIWHESELKGEYLQKGGIIFLNLIPLFIEVLKRLTGK